MLNDVHEFIKLRVVFRTLETKTVTPNFLVFLAQITQRKFIERKIFAPTSLKKQNEDFKS